MRPRQCPRKAEVASTQAKRGRACRLTKMAQSTGSTAAHQPTSPFLSESQPLYLPILKRELMMMTLVILGIEKSSVAKQNKSSAMTAKRRM